MKSLGRRRRSIFQKERIVSDLQNAIVDNSSKNKLHEDIIKEVLTFTECQDLVDSRTHSFSIKNYSTVMEHLKQNKIFFVDEAKTFEVSEYRLIVWRMEWTHRILFQILCNTLKQYNLPHDDVLSVLMSSDQKVTEAVSLFLKTVIDQSEVIFNNDVDPSFSDDGHLVSASIDKLFEIALDKYDNKNIIKVYVYCCRCFESFSDTINRLKSVHDELLEYKTKNNQLTNKMMDKERRLELFIRDIIRFDDLSAENKEMLRQFASSELLTRPLKQRIKMYVDNIADIVIGDGVKVPAVPQSCRPSRRSLKSTGSCGSLSMLLLAVKHRSINTQDDDDELDIYKSLTENTFQTISIEVAAKQLTLNDQVQLKLIPRSDVYDYKSESVTSYVQYLNKLECFFIRLCEQKHGIKYCLNLAMKCIELNSFNIAHLLYSVLIRQSINKAHKFQKFNSKYKQAFDDLNTLFAIQNNNGFFKSHYNTISESIPKTFVISMWIHDMCNYNELRSWMDEEKKQLNVVKLILVTNSIHNIFNSQNCHFNFKEQDSIQLFFARLPGIDEIE